MASIVIALSALDGADGFRLDGLDFRDQSGESVSFAGDVNGDGFADVIIGAFGANHDGLVDAGESYVVFGAAGGFGPSIALEDLDGADGFRIDGAASGDYSGIDVSAAGDLNADGFDDVVIGANLAAPGGQSRSGEAYVVFGKAAGFGSTLSLADLDGADGFRIPGLDVDDFLSGGTLAGDVDGDGVGDVILGAGLGDPNGVLSAGESYVIFGGTQGFSASFDLGALDGADGFRIDGVDSDDFSGSPRSFAGDFNGDGFADVIIGASGADPGGNSRAGETYLVFGKAGEFSASVALADLDGADGFRIDGVDSDDVSGRFVRSAGDVNGDGYSDVVIGAALADPGGLDGAGESYVVFGKASGLSASLSLADLDGVDGFRIDGVASGDNSGQEVSAAGDVNGDGFGDVIIGAPGPINGDNGRAGACFVVFGRAEGFDASIALADLDSTQGFRIDGVDIDDLTGRSVSGAGDVNGDGYDDVIVGARRGDPGSTDAGESFVVFGFDSGDVTHAGTQAAETLTGNGQANVMILGAGDDAFNAGGGGDVVRGGDGRDVGALGSGADRAFGGAGDDVLNGGLGDDILYGEAGVDRFTLGGGADVAFGGAGTDLFFERAGELGAGDRIYGGEGLQDSLVLMSTGVLDLTALDVFAGIERVRVAANQQITSTDDDLNWTGRAGAETYGLGDGRDIVRAGGGDDVILGGGGNDTLLAQGGDDRIEGGAGVDRIVTSLGADIVVLAPGMEIDIVYDFADGQDLLDAQAFGFADFAADLSPRIKDVNGNVVIDFAAGDRLVLVGVGGVDIDATDFVGVT